MRAIHKDVFLNELENMILQLVQRVMNLETLVKAVLEDFRKRLMESNQRISMPNYENLLNAKKFHLRKLISKVEYEIGSEHNKETTLVLTFDKQKLYTLQL